MSLINFNVGSLATIDSGKLAAALDEDVQRCVKDCLNRPGEKKARVVNLQVRIEPDFVDDTGDCESVKLRFALKNSLPARCTRDYSMLARKNGTLLFNDLSPGNVHQRTIDEEVSGQDGKSAAAGG